MLNSPPANRFVSPIGWSVLYMFDIFERDSLARGIKVFLWRITDLNGSTRFVRILLI